MPVAPVRRVQVDLEPGPGPIQGTVSGEQETPRRFAGWLELCALLEAARATAGEPPNR